MSIDKSDREKRLFDSIGEVDDCFLDEAETADIASQLAARRRRAQYGAVGAAASLGIAVAVWFLRPKRTVDAIESVLQEIAS